MALDLCQKFVSAQYPENKLTEFHQILFLHSYWQDLAWDCYTSFFTYLYQSYGPLFTPKFCFCSMPWEQMDRISPNFIYASILTRSTLGLLRVVLRTFVSELHRNVVSAQYFENKLTEFHQILYMHSYWQDLAWDCNTSFFAHSYHSYGPWFTPKFRFHSIFCEQIDKISPNFIYANSHL